MPIQRLPRYNLLLQELNKSTKADDPPLPDLKHALTSLRLIANEINSSLRSQSAVDIVRQIEDMFEKDDRFQPLVSPARCLVKQGALRKKFPEKSRNLLGAKEDQFFLFNDILVYASSSKSWKAGAKPSYKMKNVIALEGAKVEEVWGPKQKSKDIILKAGNKEISLSCGDPQSHKEWFAVFEQTIRRIESGGKMGNKYRESYIGGGSS